MLLPGFFLYGSRVGYLIPFHPTDAALYTELIVLNAVIYTLLSLPYWCFVGYMLSRWVKEFRWAFLLGNLPVFINVVGEMVYFAILGINGNTNPVIEYCIGSHIDKFNLFSIFFGGGGSLITILSILLSAACFLGIFALGYSLGNGRSAKVS